MKTTRRPLTTRVVVAFVVFGSLLAVLMAGFVLGAFVYTERQHIRGLIEDELSYLRQSGRPHAAVMDDLELYQGPAAELRARLEPELAGLAAGEHRMRTPARLVVVEEEVGTLRLVAIDLQPMHGRERLLLLVLALGILIAVYVSAWAGFLLSRRIVEPVRRLANQVAERSPDGGEPLSAGQADDEVGALARTLDAYEARIGELLDRERRFTGQASHELRTPITVIAGATELLLTDPGLGQDARRRAERIRRATLQMAELVETFLLLARDPDAVAATVDPPPGIAEVVRQAMDSQRVWLEGKPVTLRLDIEQDGPCPGPDRLLAIVVANLVRNACQHTEQGYVRVRVHAGGVDIEDTGPGLLHQPPEHTFTLRARAAGAEHVGGLGLPLVHSLCARQGWSVTLGGRTGGGTIAALRFEGAAPAP